MISLFFLAIIALCAGLLGTVTGFGIATVLMPIALILFSSQQALIFTGCIHWFVSFWRVIFFKKNIHKDLLIIFGIPAILGSIIGASLAFYVKSELFARLFGIFLILYASFIFMKPTFSFEIKTSKPLLGFGGILAGFSGGFFGIRGAITSFFLTLFDVKKKVYLATISSIALCIDTARLIVYFYKETMWDVKLVHLIAFSLPFAFLGAYAGEYIVKIIPEHYFRLFVIGFLCLMGIKLLLFG